MKRMYTEDATQGECEERKFASQRLQRGAVGWILLWLIGIPIPLLLLFFLIRGCT